jgi:hypothetical protein
MKEMVTEFARNPKLLVLVDKLYPNLFENACVQTSIGDLGQ